MADYLIYPGQLHSWNCFSKLFDTSTIRDLTVQNTAVILHGLVENVQLTGTFIEFYQLMLSFFFSIFCAFTCSQLVSSVELIISPPCAVNFVSESLTVCEPIRGVAALKIMGMQGPRSTSFFEKFRGHANITFYAKTTYFCRFKGMHGMGLQGMQAKTPLEPIKFIKQFLRTIFSVRC